MSEGQVNGNERSQLSARARQLILAGLAVVFIVAIVVIFSQPGSVPTSSNSGSASAQPTSSSGTTGQMDQALLQEINSLRDKITKDPKDIASLRSLGDLYFQAEQFSQAADMYSRALEVEPNNAEIHVQLGECYFYLGIGNNAVREFRAAVEINPNLAEAQFGLGVSLLHNTTPDYGGAVAAWREVVKLAPGSDIAAQAQSFIDAVTKPSSVPTN